MTFEPTYLGFLDHILNTFLASPSHKLNLDNIETEIYKGLSERSKNKYGDLVITIHEIDPENLSGNALLFLDNEGYIEINFKQKIIFITYKGIVFISDGGFTTEAKRKKRSDNLYTTYLVLMIVIGAFILLFSILTYIKTCPCKPEL